MWLHNFTNCKTKIKKFEIVKPAPKDMTLKLGQIKKRKDNGNETL